MPAQCNKEVRILNNTGGKIYVVIQGSIIRQAAIGCADGDVWLQRALGVTFLGLGLRLAFERAPRTLATP